MLALMDMLLRLAASAVHVVVDQMPLATPDPTIRTQTWFIGIGALASALAAAGTVFLAFKTAALAAETKRMADKTADLAGETRQSLIAAQTQMALEAQRHLDSFQPHIAIQTELLGTGNKDAGGIGVYLVNIGPGYAHDVRVTARGGRMRILDDKIVAMASQGRVLVASALDHQATLEQIEVNYKDAFNRPFKSVVDGEYKPGQTYRFLGPETFPTGTS